MFEQAAFLGRAVASLLAQTVTAWALLAVDDGSRRDGTHDGTHDGADHRPELVDVGPGHPPVITGR